MKLPEGFHTCIIHVDNYQGLVSIVKYMYYTSFVHDGRLYGRWLLPLNHACSRPLLLLERQLLIRRKRLYGIIGSIFYQNCGEEQVMRLNSCQICKSGRCKQSYCTSLLCQCLSCLVLVLGPVLRFLSSLSGERRCISRGVSIALRMSTYSLVPALML